MFGLLVTGILGACAVGSWAMESGKSSTARAEAKKRGEKLYWDAKHKERSVETDEICTTFFGDPTYRNHTVVRGCVTNRIYHDFTQQKADEANAKLKAEGRKWVWKEKGANKWSPWDVEKECFFHVESYLGGTISNYRRQKVYEDWKYPMEVLPAREMEPWEHGCRSICF